MARGSDGGVMFLGDDPWILDRSSSVLHPRRPLSG